MQFFLYGEQVIVFSILLIFEIQLKLIPIKAILLSPFCGLGSGITMSISLK